MNRNPSGDTNQDIPYESAFIEETTGPYEVKVYQVSLENVDFSLVGENADFKFIFSWWQQPLNLNWAVRLNDSPDFSGDNLKRKTWTTDSDPSDNLFICKPEAKMYYFEIQSQTNSSATGEFQVVIDNDGSCKAEDDFAKFIGRIVMIVLLSFLVCCCLICAGVIAVTVFGVSICACCCKKHQDNRQAQAANVPYSPAPDYQQGQQFQYSQQPQYSQQQGSQQQGYAVPVQPQYSQQQYPQNVLYAAAPSAAAPLVQQPAQVEGTAYGQVQNGDTATYA